MFPASPGSPGSCGPGSPPNRSLDDLLICPVCLDSFTDPRTLSCLHSFCTKCLENCKRPYRRDIPCPVCKKVTVLTPLGVQGLQNDFRIQQIRDILVSRPQSPPVASSDQDVTMSETKTCDICKTQQKKLPAVCHCIQCFMFFCTGCKEKHNANSIFSSHHVLNVGDNTVCESLFCKTHKDQPVRYFCRTCNLMLCTVCTMDHEPRHPTEPLDRAMIEKYREELKQGLKTVHSKLAEVSNRTKYLETLKQSHKRAMYKAQVAIHEKTEELIVMIRNQEKQMLQSIQEHMESKMKEQGMELLGDISYHRSSMEALYADLNRVLKGSPQECLVAYEDLSNRMKTLTDTSLPAVNSKTNRQVLRFVPADVNILIGSLQECSLSEDSDDDDCLITMSTSPPSGSGFTKLASPAKPQLVPRRMTSILHALSPNRKSERKSKMKTANTEQSPTSPNTISADDLITLNSDLADSNPQSGVGQCSPLPAPVSPSGPVPSPSGALGPLSPGACPLSSLSGPIRAVSPPAMPSSPSGSSIGAAGDSDSLAGSSQGQPSLNYKPKLLFKLDQVGGWPGKVTSPTGVAFLPDGNLIVAECENRLQVFDKSGHSIKIIGWGKIRPHSVGVSREGKIVVTDKKERSVKLYQMDGECVRIWGSGLFSSPSGVAVNSIGNFIVTDLDRHSVSIITPEGSVLTQFGSWGNGDYQFNNPTHVTVDQQDNIIVSDSGNSMIKIYDKAGLFLSRLSLVSSKQGQLRRPQGVTVDNQGNLIVSDRENHRISLFNRDGRFMHHILTKQDNIKYPCDVAMDGNNHLAVVETHTGFLTKDPHHAVKLYQLLS